eukprot:1681097-Pleurochrysis_carterae.AAC.1
MSSRHLSASLFAVECILLCLQLRLRLLVCVSEEKETRGKGKRAKREEASQTEGSGGRGTEIEKKAGKYAREGLPAQRSSTQAQ